MLFYGSSAAGVADRKADQRRFHGHVFLKKKFYAHFGDFLGRLDDGGADVIFIAENPYAVESNDLYIFWDFKIHAAEHSDDVVCDVVGHAKNTVKVQFSIMHMAGEESPEFFQGISILQYLHGIG